MARSELRGRVGAPAGAAGRLARLRALVGAGPRDRVLRPSGPVARDRWHQVGDRAGAGSGAAGDGVVREPPGECLSAVLGGYRAYTWQLVAAGLRGGKGVPEQVGDHPRLFVTLTAPSFGPVHSTCAGRGPSRVCHRPRRGGPRCCAHGRPLSCPQVHRAEDERVGTPLCEDCFDFPGVMVWNSAVGGLWRRTTIYVQRALARLAGLSPAALRRQVRLSFTKVAEYQARGCVHLHVVLRADGVDAANREAVLSPPGWVNAGLLIRAVREAAAAVAAPLPPVPGSVLRSARWGEQLDVRVVRSASPAGNPLAIAAYVAKYATKAAETVTTGLARPIRSLQELAARRLPAHADRLVRTCLLLDRDPALAGLGLRRWAHMLGFGGHFSSKSRRYSVTLGALRSARFAWRQAHRGGADASTSAMWEGVCGWRFAGQGWRTPADELLVATAARGRLLAAEMAREHRHGERVALAEVA